MEGESAADVTQVLRLAGGGDARAASQLAPLVYDELRRLAGAYLKGERADHTLQPTALANEAYLKLVDQTRAEWKDRNHFLAVAAQAMRRILIDHARRVRSRRKGTHVSVAGLGDDDEEGVELELLELDEAIGRLAERSERQARVIELRFFGGLTVEEAADLLGVSPRTVKDDWRVARAWLRRELSGSKGGEGGERDE